MTYTYSPLSFGGVTTPRSRRSRGRRSKSKSPLQHLEKGSGWGVKYSTLALIFLLISLLLTWWSFIESQKSSDEIVDRYGSGNISSFVKWTGTTQGKALTLVFWLLFLVLVVPDAEGIRKTIF
jgi:hypothetical protein